MRAMSSTLRLMRASDRQEIVSVVSFAPEAKIPGSQIELALAHLHGISRVLS